MSSAVIVFLVCAVACAVAHAAILVSTVSARVSSDAAAPMPRPRAWVEFVWALVPIVALALVLTATWNRVRDEHKHPPETMRIAR